MSQVPSVTISAATASSGATGGDSSASPSEKNAMSPSSAKSHSTASTSTPGPKLRSCVVCRTRKVRCDKQSPCSNCRRANIDCVFPSTDRPPRWARRLERVAKNAAANSQTSQAPDPAAAQVMDRLRTLENLVKELSGQLEQANAANSPGVNSPGSSDHDPNIQEQREASPSSSAESTQKQFGRLVLRDANRSRYVSSGFWSKVNDELDRLKMDSRGLDMEDSDTSEEETLSGRSPSTQELERAPSERHAFLFRHNLSPSAPDLREFHPLPSQIPFLLDVFSENVNSLGQFIHMPTVRNMVREMRTGNGTTLTPANEALMFSIYYAAVTSMEDDDILTNFGFSKSDLNLKFRLGLEHALARADFLNVPELVLVQAFINFLCLVRRHDSARWVWMMTGLAIRMGQALGLQRDGSHFENLTPYEIEIRRRVWAGLCILDVRASEDQGTEYSIAHGSYDTKLPLNINDADISPKTTQMPAERDEITDMTVPLASFEMDRIARKMTMTAQSTKGGAASMEEQERLSEEIYQKLESRYLRYSPSPENSTYWVFITISRLMRAKMILLTYTPILSPSLSHQVTEDIKDKLLNAAIENAEYNHALNANQACRRWRWLFQTYTHWHAIVYLLLIISKRPWSPTIERAWVALHSEWLIPAQTPKDKNQRMWIPLRKLTTKAKHHRDSELRRLRSDPRAAKALEMEDQQAKSPGSPGPFPPVPNATEFFRERWFQLLAAPEESGQHLKASNAASSTTSPPSHTPYSVQQSTCATSAYNTAGYTPRVPYESSGLGDSPWQLKQDSVYASANYQQPMPTMASNEFATSQATARSSYNAMPPNMNDWSMGPGFVPWLWDNANPSIDALADTDVNAIDVNMDMDMEKDIDWYDWVESTKGMDWDTRASGSS